jgi:transposase
LLLKHKAALFDHLVSRWRDLFNVAVEEAFKTLKGDLSIRPIYHQHEDHIEAHIFIVFLAYCLHVMTRSALEKFSAVQMIDVHIPTTDRRELTVTRYIQPDPELQLLLERLKLTLPGVASKNSEG